MSESAHARQLRVTEALDLRFLPDEGLRFDEPLPAAWLDTQLAENDPVVILRADEDGHAKIDVQPLRPVATRPPIRISGTAQAAVSTTCVRCLQPIRERLDAEVEVTLFPGKQAAAPKGSASKPRRASKNNAAEDEDEGLSPAELDEGTYEGHTLDLPALIREALILESAMNPSCEDEAACTERTEVMLREANQGAEGAVPDRWAALRALVTPPGSGDS
jgi:uncharacterized protein